MDASLPGDLIELEAGTYDRPPLFNLTMFQKHGEGYATYISSFSDAAVAFGPLLVRSCHALNAAPEQPCRGGRVLIVLLQ